ncbi:MAG TPA: hypothetical protein VLI05_06090 [Candidatus Saccharimonadia bacterium]|nr:hypothetical protein [Candidatus Saccharimonadia bacterium]
MNTSSLGRRLVLGLIVLLVIGGAGWLAWGQLNGGLAPARTVGYAANSTATSKLAPILRQPVDLVTPLGAGYLFLNQLTGGLNYADVTGAIDLSSRIRLTASSDQAIEGANGPINDALINIEPTQNGEAIITTTMGVFLAHNAHTIIELPSYTKGSLNFVSSSYDASNHSLFLLSAYDKGIYRYQIDQPTSRPTKLYSSPLEVNRIVAGGGHVAVYFDDVPTTDPAVLAEYGKTRQLDPLIIDAASGKLIKTLTGFQPVTYLSISASGHYVALKRKFELAMTVLDLATNRRATLPSYDTSGATWLGDILQIARDHAIWSYDATSSTAELVKLADVAEPVASLARAGSTLLATTTDSVTALLVPSGQTAMPALLGQAPAPAAHPYQYFGPAAH